MKASVEIEFFDDRDNLIEMPAVLNLLTNYVVQAVVTNRTVTTGGHAYEAQFEVGFGINLDGVEILPYTVYPPREFAADQFQFFTKRFYIPEEYAGLTGKVLAVVLDPFGSVLASVQKRFKIGFEISPYAIYEAPGKVLAKGTDMIHLSPDLDMSEGQVVIGVEGAAHLPPAPPAPPKPKPVHNPNDKSVPLGIDCTTEPEEPVEFEGETVSSSGRLG